MKNEVLYDLTTHDLGGLIAHFGLSEKDIFSFFYQSSLTGSKSDAKSFLQYFKIDSEKVLEKDIFLTSLHVTTSEDCLASIKKWGIVNLQDAITLDTSLKKHLLSYGLLFSIEEKALFYKGKKIDISQEYTANLENPIQWIIYKLFIDYSITSFFSVEDATEYLGKVHERPEFLKNVFELIDEPNLIDDWLFKTECYIIKYRSNLENFSEESFNIDLRRVDFNSSNNIELQKRLWVINKALENQKYGYKEMFFSYMKENISIPYTDFISVYNIAEYKESYKIL